MRVSRIDETEESEEIDPDGYELINSNVFSRGAAGRVFAYKLQG
jgi:hypothetical protein